MHIHAHIPAPGSATTQIANTLRSTSIRYRALHGDLAQFPVHHLLSHIPVMRLKFKVQLIHWTERAVTPWWNSSTKSLSLWKCLEKSYLVYLFRRLVMSYFQPFNVMKQLFGCRTSIEQITKVINCQVSWCHLSDYVSKRPHHLWWKSEISQKTHLLFELCYWSAYFIFFIILLYLFP